MHALPILPPICNTMTNKIAFLRPNTSPKYPPTNCPNIIPAKSDDATMESSSSSSPLLLLSSLFCCNNLAADKIVDVNDDNSTCIGDEYGSSVFLPVTLIEY